MLGDTAGMLSPLRQAIQTLPGSPTRRLCMALDWDRTPSRRLVRQCPPGIAAEYLAYANDWATLAQLFARVPAAAVHILTIEAVDPREHAAATQAQHLARVSLAADAARRALAEAIVDV